MFTFVETKLFTRLVQECLTDDDYAAVQRELIADPDAGSVIRGSGGIRKLRVAAPGRGKRGGYRLIYFVRRPKQLIWMLTIYPKNVAESIPTHVLRKISEEAKDD